MSILLKLILLFLFFFICFKRFLIFLGNFKVELLLKKLNKGYMYFNKKGVFSFFIFFFFEI